MNARGLVHITLTSFAALASRHRRTRVMILSINIGSYPISQVIPHFPWFRMTHIHINLSLYFSTLGEDPW